MLLVYVSDHATVGRPEGDSDQVVVTTLADLFDIKKAYAKDNAAQLVGSMTSDDLRQIAEKGYSSRSEVLTHHLDRADRSSISPQTAFDGRASTYGPATRCDHITVPAAQIPETKKPVANENKKRYTDEAAEENSRHLNDHSTYYMISS